MLATPRVGTFRDRLCSELIFRKGRNLIVGKLVTHVERSCTLVVESLKSYGVRDASAPPAGAADMGPPSGSIIRPLSPRVKYSTRQNKPNELKLEEFANSVDEFHFSPPDSHYQSSSTVPSIVMGS
ncbi:hypothetical protein EVAR_35574_1 [Eumeta japonica]|uniref:Uncharacterized protein n=1 Tax=Eumeta variegata TaxID=151549 RepID=A0A4C1XPQ7_EUMVA|nr:hypothetical protein EVAR_35574_1 [Eumeta japonica]